VTQTHGMSTASLQRRVGGRVGRRLWLAASALLTAVGVGLLIGGAAPGVAWGLIVTGVGAMASPSRR